MTQTHPIEYHHSRAVDLPVKPEQKNTDTSMEKHQYKAGDFVRILNVPDPGHCFPAGAIVRVLTQGADNLHVEGAHPKNGFPRRQWLFDEEYAPWEPKVGDPVVLKKGEPTYYLDYPSGAGRAPNTTPPTPCAIPATVKKVSRARPDDSLPYFLEFAVQHPTAGWSEWAEIHGGGIWVGIDQIEPGKPSESKREFKVGDSVVLKAGSPIRDPQTGEPYKGAPRAGSDTPAKISDINSIAAPEAPIQLRFYEPLRVGSDDWSRLWVKAEDLKPEVEEVTKPATGPFKVGDYVRVVTEGLGCDHFFSKDTVGEVVELSPSGRYDVRGYRKGNRGLVFQSVVPEDIAPWEPKTGERVILKKGSPVRNTITGDPLESLGGMVKEDEAGAVSYFRPDDRPCPVSVRFDRIARATKSSWKSLCVKSEDLKPVLNPTEATTAPASPAELYHLPRR